ncbi:hypothetical protein Cadr_000002299 [Camelus dromedarius]|uniref:Uncharacterized protein n=1 Tax=Camelus dromedarius TaxID=9838 RepID=A0A5N4EI83_CAMDR|nr:hypothetical protein Cadr_000002299 [Camelus dromedarius]
MRLLLQHSITHLLSPSPPRLSHYQLYQHPHPVSIPATIPIPTAISINIPTTISINIPATISIPISTTIYITITTIITISATTTFNTIVINKEIK